ncbi:CpsD/CapB family tyrosine-protein kinase [Paenibacillus humicola]|uniref:CpsD/CapB family tyrosine-protein kinase n=1 Tax=Paenibacillus humicola TaxID=3110540 RepID=UPI00237A29AC|nr:CpsD/CapB family tyrosine-protein kinase [Paenibacillus humicola]
MSRLMRNQTLVTEINPRSRVSEIYRSLRTNIEFSIQDSAFKTLAVTSALAGEGKSTTAANIAATFARTGRKTLLIDANLRAPVQHDIFGLPNHFGLSSALTAGNGVEEAVQRTHAGSLEVMCSGPIPPNPSELLDSPQMTALLNEAKERYDVVIVDTTSVLEVTDAQIVASKCDGVLLVIKPGKVKNEIAVKAKASLEYGKATVIGAVLNEVGR